MRTDPVWEILACPTNKKRKYRSQRLIDDRFQERNTSSSMNKAAGVFPGGVAPPAIG
ncbi:hypothetical protein IF2G_00615 [Cordyceps javanica]|nr:hypothetical protein IF2G_00615 [Cordyceps javanica]